MSGRHHKILTNPSPKKTEKNLPIILMFCSKTSHFLMYFMSPKSLSKFEVGVMIFGHNLEVTISANHLRLGTPTAAMGAKGTCHCDVPTGDRCQGSLKQKS